MGIFGFNFKTGQGRLGISTMWTSEPIESQRFSLTNMLVVCFVITIGIMTEEINLTCAAAPSPTKQIVSNAFGNSTSKENKKGISSDFIEIPSPEYIFSGPVIVGGNANETLEYESEMILRCRALGRSETNVTWEYNDKPLNFKYTTVVSQGSEDDEDDLNASENVTENVLKPAATLEKLNTLKAEDNQVRVRKTEASRDTHLDENSSNVNPVNASYAKSNGKKFSRLSTSWVDIRLPKLNMALYGKFTCRAVNEEGMSVKQYVIVPNANSSVFMKLVRTCAALCILAAFVGTFRLLQKYRIRRKLMKYEKLPNEEQQIIRRFHNGNQTLNGCGVAVLPNKCDTAVSAMTNESSEETSSNDLNGSLKINSWVNTAAYDDKMELTTDFFEIDFNVEIQCNSFGKIVDGKVRSLKTLSWKKVGVKMENPVMIDAGKQLDGLLTEIKVLLSLNDHHQFIVNLQGAYTKKLYRRQVYIFLDSCKLGPLSTYLEVHYPSFMNQMMKSSSNASFEFVTYHPPTELRHEAGRSEPVPIIPDSDMPVTTDCPISVLRLIIWSTQIACGIKFLHKRNILHGNLSTDNVFLTKDFIAKVGNIGYSPLLSSGTDDKTVPPECKRSLSEFTFKTDVWMFGLTLWEIFSMRQGKIPSSQEINDFYTYGKAFNTEKLHSPQNVNELMHLCWNPQDDMRPDSEFLAKSLEGILETEAKGTRNPEN